MKFFTIIFLNLVLISLACAGVHDKFFADFELRYTIGSCYVVPEPIKAQLKNPSSFEREEAKLCLIPNKILDQSGLILFSVTKSACHACTPEIWVYDSSKPKNIYFLTEDIGSWGEAGTIEKVLVDRRRVIIVFQMIYAQMGESIGSYFVVEFDKNKKAGQVLHRFSDSDHSFDGNESTQNCSGWKTILRTDPHNKVISFVKSGFLCDYKNNNGSTNGAKFSQKIKFSYRK